MNRSRSAFGLLLLFIIFSLFLNQVRPAVGQTASPLGTTILIVDKRQADQFKKTGLLPVHQIDYGSYLWMEFSPSDSQQARNMGVTAQEIENPFLLTLGGQTFDPTESPNELQGNQLSQQRQGPDFHLIQMIGPTLDPWLETLQNNGLQIVQYIHPYTYVVWGETNVVQQMRKLEFVRWVGPFLPEYRLLPENNLLSGQTAEVQAVVYQGADRTAIENELRGLGRIKKKEKLDPTFEVVRMEISGKNLAAAAQIPGIYSIQPIRTDGGLRGEISNQVNAGNISINNLAYPGYQTWLNTLGLSGSGVTIANVDSGIDQNHPDLANRILPCSGTTCGNNASSSHGTHTAGIMAADGTSGVKDSSSFLRGQGVAPGASLIEQLYSPYYTYTNGMLLLMSESVRNGAVISGNSWGPSSTAKGYDNDTRQVDIGVRDADPEQPGNQPLMVVVSIMNGYGGVSTQGTPDEAKNAFTIGSTKLQPSSGAQYTDINNISSNSGHGPALDGRNIPHMVAPGCSIDSTSLSSSYEMKCGTSMASPQVSGASALFFEYYRKLFGLDPSPALVKAAFLAAAHDLAGNQDADGVTLGHPFDSKQGWGRLNLAGVLDPGAQTLYFDNPVVFDQSGEDWQRTFYPADSNQPVKLMLVWTDAPGHGLGGSTPAWNNNLDLIVTRAGQTYHGNAFGTSGWSTTDGTADPKNNTEGIFFNGGSADNFTVQVLGTNIASDGIPNQGDLTDQDFALVCSNCSEQPDFTLQIETPLDICAPNNGTTNISAGSIAGFSAPVELTVSTLPEGANGEFTPNPVNPPGSAQLTITGSGGLASGNYPLIVTGTSGGINHSTPFELGIFDQLPAIPLLSQPANLAAGQPVQPTLLWNASGQARSYTLQIALDASFSNLVIEKSNLTSTSYTLETALTTNTKYYWRVKANNVCGESSFSTTYQFSTLAAPGDCPVDTTPIILYEAGFENNTGGLSHSGTLDSWIRTDEFGYLSTYSFHADDPSAVSDQRLQSPPIRLPSNSLSPISLNFYQRHYFEGNTNYCFDGGLLQYSLDDGATWISFTNTDILENPYNGTVANGFSNPLSGLAAWCGDQDWRNTLIDLSSLAGHTVQFRFRFGSDGVAGDEGWSIDDVKVQACQAPSPAEITVTPPTDSQTGLPGSTITYTLQITNQSGAPDQFFISISGNQWESVLSDTSIAVGAGETQAVSVLVTIPNTASGQAVDSSVVTITSNNNPAISTAAALVTTGQIVQSYTLTSPLQNSAIYPGKIAIYALTVNNTGNIQETFHAKFFSSLGWTVTSLPDRFIVEPAQSKEIAVTVSAPYNSPENQIDTSTAQITLENGVNDFQSLQFLTTIKYYKLILFPVYR